ncbi:MAG TPA: YbhB/YbcL family Raf kinase inhibitor-like protein [Aggregatilineaceae bacterium]|nr:YbhB/YbcL family Raf kinase inhibitor-like protein [Aggregatilineaceae bacterium]
MAFVLHSSDFPPGALIPIRFTCSGSDISPALLWSDPPPETDSLALICEDPDAPRGLWVHWVIYNIPKDTRGLLEAIPKVLELPDGTRQGVNDFGRTGYAGPCPPPGHGKHRYFFRLYALDVSLMLLPDATRADLLQAMEGYILAEAELMGLYER